LAAAREGLAVEWTEVADVVGDQGALFAAGERHDLAICESFALGVAADGLDVVSAAAEFASDRWSEHLVEQ
jgi:hypothetical protein